MECSVCGSQDTKPVSGISKKTGKPWKAYDCNEPQCKNEKGYPSRTFVPAPRSPRPVVFNREKPQGLTLEQKVDKILAILTANFKTSKEEPIPFENSDEPLHF